MRYDKTIEASFIDRPNRFIAHVAIEGVAEVETVHVKNTGRCRELLVPGARVVLAEGSNPNRKTRYDLIGVYKDGLGYINMDSNAPNSAVKEWLEKPSNPIFPDITYLKPECKYGDSRIDFYLEQGETRVFIEVKGVTLEVDGQGYFPDAPSERAVKHLHELVKVVEEGYQAYIAFVIQMPGISSVEPNAATDPAFAKAFNFALEHGVKVLYLQCEMTHDEVKIKN